MGGRLSSGTISKLAISLRSSFWFLPGLIVLASIALAVGLVAVDRAIGRLPAERWPALFEVDADGARELLAVIAGSMVTVAGVVFSITIAALAQASAQYTSRVLRNFMRDRANQTVLGVFLGVFAYCLGVLRTINTNGEDGFVPLVAVAVGLLLALVGVAFLVFFIHHVASGIQSGAIARGIAVDTLDTIERVFPDADDGDDGDDAVPVPGTRDRLRWHPVPAPGLGYIESVDLEGLLDVARDLDVVVRMERSVGDFATPDRPIASIAAPGTPDADALPRVAGTFAVDSYRTIEQDVAFGIRQLVDVALKALSPGINDTTTAVTALDYLSVIVQRLAGRRIAPRPLCDGDTVRVVPAGPRFERLLGLAFDQILENAHGNTTVLLRMLQAVEQVRAGSRSPVRLRMLDALRDTIAGVARRTASCGHARQVLEDQLAGATTVGEDTAGA